MDSASEVTAAHGRQSYINGVTIAFLVISWLVVSLRMYVRAFMIKNFGWDDAVMLLAAISNTIYSTFNFLLISYGFGNPRLLLEPPSIISKITTYIVATFGLYAATMIIVKISLGIFYLRIAVSTWQRWTIYITVGISTIFGTYYFFAALFQCGNPAHFLENAYAGKCGNTDALLPVNVTAGVINAASDLILVILPIFLIRKACMPMPAKVSACAVIALGSVGGIVALVRLKYIPELTYGGNFFETGVSITIWSIVEVGICITAASLATLRPLFKCCMDHTRRAMTPTVSSTMKKGSQLSSLGTSAGTNRSQPDRPVRPSSMMSFQDRGVRTAMNAPGGYKLSPVTSSGDKHINKVNLSSNVNANAAPFHDYEPGFTRRASLHQGRVRWDESPVESPTLPPPRPLPLASLNPRSRHGLVPQNSPAQNGPKDTPLESPVIPVIPVGPPHRAFREATVQKPSPTPPAPKSPSWKKSLSPSWPKDPSWPKLPSKKTRPPPLQQASMQWNPPGERPLIMRENSHEKLPTQHPYFRDSAYYMHTQVPKSNATDRPTKERSYNEPPSQPRAQQTRPAPAYSELPQSQPSRQRFPVAPAYTEQPYERAPSRQRYDPVPAYTETPVRQPARQYRYGAVLSQQPVNPGPPPPLLPRQGDYGPYGQAFGGGEYNYTTHGDVEQAVRRAGPRLGRQGGFI